MANCKFLRQKKQVKINGEWVDTRSYRYLPYCDGGISCVIIKGGTPNDNVVIGVNKYDNSSSTEKSLSLDGDGNGYIELESDDCITYINEEKESPSSIAEIRGCYVNKFGRVTPRGYYDMDTMIVYCSTYKTPLESELMFNHALTANNLIFRGFDTSKVTDMSFMFTNCYYITSLNVSNFNTSNVTSMNFMFEECQVLTSLDLSGWDMSNVTYNTDMFRQCSSLNTIRMIGCSQTTIDKIKDALSSANILDQVTIIT